MGTNTTKLGLLKPHENDFYNQQTEQSENWDKVDKFADDIQKNVDFNLLATLGIEYGGILNNTEAKVAGKAYYDTAGKKIFKCIANTSINYADAGFFEAISNNDLLIRLNNLSLVKLYPRSYQDDNKLKINSEGYRFIVVEIGHSQPGVDTTYITLRFDKLNPLNTLTCVTPLWGHVIFAYDNIKDEISCDKRTHFGAFLSNA